MRFAARCTSSASTARPQAPSPPQPPPVLVPRRAAGESLPPSLWLNAALLVDKPVGYTSFDVCARLRGALRTKKIGHAGTLDPFATGLLVICTGRGTKWVDTFQAQEKCYSGVLRLGEATPSYDKETPVSLSLPWEHLTDAQLQAAAATFVGDIQQVPPMYSAIKQQGVALYKLARAGETVERPPRSLHVRCFDLSRQPGSQDVAFTVQCSKGTYIRSLAHDLGAALGSAAHLTVLRREAIGEHSVNNAWPLEELLAAGRAGHAAAQAAQGEV